MERIYSEADITWSSIEKYVDYSSVRWTMDKSGIPVYTFMDEKGGKIDIDFNNYWR